MTMMNQRSARRGFTLVELLVVLFIVGLVSAATLPIIIPTLTQRQVQEGSRILQQALINARFAAMSTGRAAGIRLLPDPILTGPDASDPLRPLAYNRMVQLEPAPDYSDGQVIVQSPGATESEIINFFLLAGNQWRDFLIGNPLNTMSKGYQDPFKNQLAPSIFKDPRIVVRQFKSTLPVEPTSWSWNVRAGDRITVGLQNKNQFVIAGPTAPLDWSNSLKLNFIESNNTIDFRLPNAAGIYNPERFIAIGDPRKAVNFQLPTTTINSQVYNSEILILVNEGNHSFDGIDNNNDLVIDPAFDGIDNDRNGYVDDPTELFYNSDSSIDPANLVYTNRALPASQILQILKIAFEWEPAILEQNIGYTNPLEYRIKRRMVPAANSSDIGLPSDVVIDATTALDWFGGTDLTLPNMMYSSTTVSERSRLPIDRLTRNVDIIFQPDGQVVTSSASSVNNAPFQVPFYHLWLTDRGDVFSPTNTTGMTNDVKDKFIPRLPLPKGILGSSHMNFNNDEWALKNERRMITIQTRTGRITSQSLEVFESSDQNLPYQDAQKGIAEVGQ
jgi:prepilin-type N-terminal cleavage/methylation domain-containing protein